MGCWVLAFPDRARMPRWLSSILITIGFVALVALALLPRNVTVTVQVDAETNQSFYNAAPHDMAAANSQPADSDDK